MKNNTYSTTYRILHWAIAISFILLLITIFLRTTWMEKEHVAGIIGAFLNENGQQLPQDQLIVLAKQIREPMWQWHVYLGYVLVGLFAVRFALPFWGEMQIQNPFSKGLNAKQKFQRWVYIVFYCGVVISLTTGLLIKFGFKDWKNSLEEIHELSIYYLLVYIVLHLSGVIIAEFTSHKGIISKIVSGDKKTH
ncbi:cytochrome b/b6 domain-containing protein [Psychroflexus lacisalsi]|nr:cytochrome b/b6 domain-containing protein [Psychroflexus lacisalsi]MBZ9619361.1 cytochrome b/b6 domain-containing protein [Psychroflexus lacisalsi]